MAPGQRVTLRRRLFLNAGKTALAEEGTPEAAWFLGGEGVEIDKDYAMSLGLVEGDDFGEPDNGLNALLEQERRNREAGAMSANAFVKPAPVSTATTPDRLTFHRETGDLLVDPNLAANRSVMPGVLEQPHMTPSDQDQAASGTPSEAQTAVASSTSPLPKDGEGEGSDAAREAAVDADDNASTSSSRSSGGTATRAQGSAPQTRERKPDENK